MSGPIRAKVMHIALAHGGGVEVYVRMLIQNTGSDYDTVLVCPPGFNHSELVENISEIYELDCPREISIFRDIAAIRKIKKIINSEKPDIVYCHSSMAGAVGRLAARNHDCRIIYNSHGWAFAMRTSEIKRKIYRLIERAMAKYTDRIVTISEFEKRLALDNCICSEDKIQVILNGIDLDRCRREGKLSRQELKIADGDFVVGCAARISEQKNPLFFAEVAGLIKAEIPEARFIWVGDGELKDDFIQALKENNVYSDTIITGWVNDPNDYIALFDVAVLFSKWEGFGMALVEYMAQGKPVVASKTDAIPEVLTDNRNGRLVSGDDPKCFAAAVMEYYECKSIAEIRENCLTDAEKFDFSVTAKQTKRLFNELIERKS